jgi:DNA-binding winged helix-turn-helix (wHTH) protein
MRDLADMLQVLARTAGGIVTNDALMDRIWPGRSCSKHTR